MLLKRSSKQQFCNKGCASTYSNKRRKKGVKKTHQVDCTYCNKKFETSDYNKRRNNNHFCCKEHYNLYNESIAEDKCCDQCGKSMPKNYKSKYKRFCSKKCYMANYVSNAIPADKELNYRQFRNRVEFSPQYITWRNNVIKRYNGKCAICGSEEKTNAHHIIAFYIIVQDVLDTEYTQENFEEIMKIDLLFNENNGICLCSKHHDMAHNRSSNNK